MTSLFFEIFSSDLPRQGPGDRASTLKALALVPNVGPGTRILDVGCGSGPQTLVLAEASHAAILAVDTHEPFISALIQQTQMLGLAGRVDARVGDMRHLDYPPGSFDLLWCEGAIYIMGFEAALRDWRRLLTPGGHLVVSEIVWTRPNPPSECATFWEREYPAISDVPTMLANIRRCGYETVGHFTLPPSSWSDEYYQPLQRKLAPFRERHKGENDAQELADQVQREIDMWRAYSDFYSYEFFVMRVM
jgi:ubiquinone/menaquinone biosynthesis C-methylase UbiE